MRINLLAALALTIAVGACGSVRESRLNPLNWFGGSQAQETTVVRGTGVVRPADPRPLVDQVIAMRVEQTPGGAIVRATGLPPTQGFWDAELVPFEGEGVDEGVLVFDFRLIPPPYRARVGTQPSREVIVATTLTNNELDGIARIVVRGARTERVARR